jgi:DNA-binding transcriptional MerR regulator
MHAGSRLSRPLQSIMVGLARTFDFANALSQRTVTRSAEEDMALAWREVYSGLPPLRDLVPQPDQQPPSAQDTDTLTEPVHAPESRKRPPKILSAAHADLPGREIGYRGPTACAAAGITYRQLDYWARTGLVEPSVRAGYGSASQRLYSFRDILVLKVIKRLLDTGVSLQQIRFAVQHLRSHGVQDLARVYLLSDGVSVYECTSPDEVVDLLAGGQGVFGIALGRVWQEVAGELMELPAVRADDGLIVRGAEDPMLRSSTA